MNFFRNHKTDFTAGVIVFLIALPLCLGIAQASHAPLISGIIAGVIGGIVIGFISKSTVSVSGPAAGLIAIVIGAIEQLNSFEIFLCAVIIAGAIQLFLGILKAGSIASYFPSSVIEGMLAGIGLTIIIKEIPNAVGFLKTDETSGIADADDGFFMNTILDSLQHIEPGAVIITLVGITILALFQLQKFKKYQIIPAGVLVVLFGVFLNELFLMTGSSLYLDATHLVRLPVPANAQEFMAQLTMPDFSGLLNPLVWQTGLVIAIVASIETLLCIEATDKLNPHKSFTPGNRELIAQGVGNMFSGFVGGLPITSVIVRSSANINAGAKSKIATITHGVLLLVCVLSVPSLLNHIPKASLAAILLFTGYRLCRPSVFKHMWKEGGRSQFIPFVITVTAVVSLDLLKGVGIGMVISVFYLLRQSMNNPYYFHMSKYSNNHLIKITLAQEVTFLNKASIKSTLEKLPVKSVVILDASETEFIDFDVLDLIREFTTNQAAERDIKVSLIGFKEIYRLPKSERAYEVLSDLVNLPEMPQRTSGDHKKLIEHLHLQKQS